jgi:hypothetical protein
MTNIYMKDEDYDRLIEYQLETFMGGILKDRIRDELMFALGERAGIWPESCRPVEGCIVPS